MAKINENKLAKDIAEEEGGELNLGIAQVKEVQKLILDKLANEWTEGNEDGVIQLIKKHQLK